MTDFFNKLNTTHFPGGKKQIKENAEKIREIMDNKITLDQAEKVLLVAKAMLSINESKVPNVIKKEIGEYLNDDKLIKIVTFITFGDVNDETIKATTQGYNFTDMGYNDDEIPFGVGEFGRCNTNPIPTKGIISNNSYLERLKTKNGGGIKWQRINSEEPQVGGITGLIDVYEITNEGGKSMGNLYLSPYNQKTSDKAPTGFIIEGGYVVNSDEDLQKKINSAWNYKKNGKLQEALGIYNQVYDFICIEAGNNVRTGNVVVEGVTAKILPSYFSEADKYLKQNDMACRVANNMAVIFAELGDYENARKMFEEAIRLTPDDMDYLDPKIGLENISN